MADNDDWDFKIERGVNPEPVKKTPSKKASLEEIASAFSKEEPQDLTLDHDALPPRSVRVGNFKSTVALERFAAIKAAPLKRRIQAGVIDLLFVGICAVACWMTFPLWRESLEKSLPSGFLGQIPNAQALLEYVIPVLVIFIVHIYPSMLWKKSFGKKLYDLRIGYKDDDCGISKLTILWREAIAKPLSLISVIGFFLIFLNKRHRGLHDFLSGSVVYDEL